MFMKASVICFSSTATAPPHVEAELISSLHMRNPVVVQQPLDRPNIYFSASRSAGMKVTANNCIIWFTIAIMFRCSKSWDD